MRPFYDDPNRIESSLDTLIPDNPNTPYDMEELIEKLADEGDFYEIQGEFAKNIITGFVRLEGQTVGVVANQPMVLAGCLDIDSSRKAARFVRFCDAFEIPILTLVDVQDFYQVRHRNMAALSSMVRNCYLLTVKQQFQSYCYYAKSLRGSI